MSQTCCGSFPVFTNKNFCQSCKDVFNVYNCNHCNQKFESLDDDYNIMKISLDRHDKLICNSSHCSFCAKCCKKYNSTGY